jgi:hypothetical protein
MQRLFLSRNIEAQRMRVVSTELIHSGRQLSHVSAAARHGPRVILGSVADEGVLVCEDVPRTV